MTYALREARAHATQPLPAQIARLIALIAPFAAGFPSHSFHEPFHARGVLSPQRVKVSPIRPGAATTFDLDQTRPSITKQGLGDPTYR